MTSFFRVLTEVARKVVDEVNKLPIKASPPQYINYVATGTVTPKPRSRKPSEYLLETGYSKRILILPYTSQQKWLSQAGDQTLLFGQKQQ